MYIIKLTARLEQSEQLSEVLHSKKNSLIYVFLRGPKKYPQICFLLVMTLTVNTIRNISISSQNIDYESLSCLKNHT